MIYNESTRLFLDPDQRSIDLKARWCRDLEATEEAFRALVRVDWWGHYISYVPFSSLRSWCYWAVGREDQAFRVAKAFESSLFNLLTLRDRLDPSETGKLDEKRIRQLSSDVQTFLSLEMEGGCSERTQKVMAEISYLQFSCERVFSHVWEKKDVSKPFRVDLGLCARIEQWCLERTIWKLPPGARVFQEVRELKKASARDVEEWFSLLEGAPREERKQWIDVVSPMDLGYSTLKIHEIIESLPREKDRELLLSLMDQREKALLDDVLWKQLVQECRGHFEELCEAVEESKDWSKKLLHQLEEDESELMGFLAHCFEEAPSFHGEHPILKKFQEWVIRDGFSVESFAHAAFVRTMKDHYLADCVSMAGDSIRKGKEGHFQILMNKDYVNWTDVSWREVFIAHQFVRTERYLSEQKWGEDPTPEGGFLYYYPQRGLLRQDPLQWKEDFETMEPYQIEVRSKKRNKGSPALPELSLVVSYEGSGNMLAGTHSFLKLWMPEGEEGEEYRMYAPGLFSNPGITETKYQKWWGKLSLMRGACSPWRVEPELNDQNLYYPDRWTAELSHPISLNDKQMKAVRDVFKHYWQSHHESDEHFSRNIFKEKKHFVLRDHNCTHLVHDVLEAAGIPNVPTRMPIYHSLSEGSTSREIFEKIYNFPSFLRYPCSAAVGVFMGASFKQLPDNVTVDNPWLLRLWIQANNELKRFMLLAKTAGENQKYKKIG